MIELYQYESCPQCARVRQKLNAMMRDFVVRQVAPDPSKRDRLIQATGQNQVPALVDSQNGIVVTEADDIIAYLEETRVPSQP